MREIREVEVLLELALVFVNDIYEASERERLRKFFKKMIDEGRRKGYRRIVDEVRGLDVREYVEREIVKKILEELEHE